DRAGSPSARERKSTGGIYLFRRPTSYCAPLCPGTCYYSLSTHTLLSCRPNAFPVHGTNSQFRRVHFKKTWAPRPFPVSNIDVNSANATDVVSANATEDYEKNTSERNASMTIRIKKAGWKD